MTPAHWTAYVEHWTATMHALGTASTRTDAWRIVAIEHAAQDAMHRWATPLLDLDDAAAVDAVMSDVDAHGKAAWEAGRDRKPTPALPQAIRDAAALLLSAPQEA